KSGGSAEEVPRFHYFVGVQDKIVFEPQRSFYTEYDKYEGAVPGGHGDLKSGLDVNSVLMQRLIQLVQEALARSPGSQLEKIAIVKEATRKREQATQEKHVASLPIPTNLGQSVSHVILISCSATKSDAPGSTRPRGGGI